MQQMSPELANGHASWENSAALPSPQPQEPMPNWNGGNWISSSEAKGPRGRGRILFGSDEDAYRVDQRWLSWASEGLRHIKDETGATISVEADPNTSGFSIIRLKNPLS